MNRLPDDAPEEVPLPRRSFWVRTLGLVLLLGSVGLVSCQSLFAL